MTLSPNEEEILGCLVDLGAKSGRLVPVKSLWHWWIRSAPGGRNAEFAEAVRLLAQRGLVHTPDGDRSETVSLTEKGLALVRTAANPGNSAEGPVNIFNIGHIGTATGLGVFGDGTAIVPSSALAGDDDVADEDRAATGRAYFAPELARIVVRQIAVIGRIVPNFIVTSTGKGQLPGDRWASLKPAQPVLYPSAPEFRNLSAPDATSLIEFYDSLQEISDIIDEWTSTQPTEDFNAWNLLMQKVQHNLEVGRNAVLRFCPDRQYSAQIPAAGRLVDQADRAISVAKAALAAHLARHGLR